MPSVPILLVHTACSDIDECVAKTHDCDVNASCSNTIGSFTCSCNTGFTFNAISGKCEDIDECLTNADDCHIMATCQNTFGSFDCTCGTDWNGDGHGQFGCAQDVCSLCDASASCVNDQCVCPVGFEGNGIDCTRTALVIPIQKSPSTAGRRQNTCRDSYWLEIAEDPNNVVVLNRQDKTWNHCIDHLKMSGVRVYGTIDLKASNVYPIETFGIKQVDNQISNMNLDGFVLENPGTKGGFQILVL